MEKEGCGGRVVDGDRGRGSGEIDILYCTCQRGITRCCGGEKCALSQLHQY